MRARPSPVESLVMLAQLSDPSERRASFRQAMAALGQGLVVHGPPPLDGVDADVLVKAAQVALDTGLADDLDFLGPGTAAVALYELTAALPTGKQRRELGRRVYARVYEGTAQTFATVAARMALGAGRSFDAATVRARIGLVFDMPVGAQVNPDPLALTLVTDREFRRKWLIDAGTRTLHERRLAAKLIEHAAREAVGRAEDGDQHPMLQLMRGEASDVFETLLADREPLVWRHAAVARGLLAHVAPALESEIETGLDEGLTPTEWRRAAVSLVATLVRDPQQTLRACRRVIEGPIGKKDPGMAATMVLGLPRVIEAEPDAAEELIEFLASTRRPDVAEAVAALLGDLSNRSFGRNAAQKLRATLASRAEGAGSVLRAIAERALRLLDGDADDEDDVGSALRQALSAFEQTGARAAFELAQKAAARLHHSLDFIAAHDAHDAQMQPYILGSLSEVDASALERPRLHQLLLLGRRPGDTTEAVPELDRFYQRLGTWLVDAESNASAAASSPAAGLAEQRRLRALLHLVDAETTRGDDDSSFKARLRRAVQVILKRTQESSGSVVERIACATLARSCDAAVREGFYEPSDLLLTLLSQLVEPRTFETLAEASTNPDVSSAVAAYAAFLAPEELDESATDTDRALHAAERVIALSHSLGGGGSYRGEALRRVLLRLGRGLETVSNARAQAELVDVGGSGSDVLGDIEASAAGFRRLIASATRRTLELELDEIAVVTDVPPLSALIERAVSSGVPPTATQLEMAISEVAADLPRPFAEALGRALGLLGGLPTAASSDVYAIPLERRREILPDWLLPSRTIGSFYVVRALGSGGAASVFVARRTEERNDPKAEGFALKVPDYDPTIARSLSEQEFFQLFREEAGALLSLPQHENLARFVTFDLGARPKPILVMELIKGQSLDRLVRNRTLTTERAFQYLDGILGGLEAMHGAGVGHLDLKPSNVILRDGDTPVLVDFGLSGRQLRPGCGTLEYCAPEVVGIVPKDHTPTPQSVDIYAFGCVAFEFLTADTLFQADDEMALLSLHVEHDGWPPKVAAMGRDPILADLGKLLARCLRRDPRQRPSATQLRKALGPLAQKYRSAAWPIPLPASAAQRSA
jgi:hypothetical protein